MFLGISYENLLVVPTCQASCPEAPKREFTAPKGVQSKRSVRMLNSSAPSASPSPESEDGPRECRPGRGGGEGPAPGEARI